MTASTQERVRDRAVLAAALAWRRRSPRPVAAAVLPRSSDGETLLEGPVESNVGPRTPAGHIWDSSGTLAFTPAPQGGGGTGTAASRGLGAHANAL